jgi:hypothetical protein
VVAGPLLGRTLPIGQVQGDFLGDPGDPGIFWGVSFGSFFVGGPFQLGRNPFFFFTYFFRFGSLWFQTWLDYFSIYWDVILTINIFQMVETTNQIGKLGGK